MDEIRNELEQREEEQLAPYALKSKSRRIALGDTFREKPEDTALELRTEYHRDRDRIIWSSAFRRLQHKTQIFPHYAEDHYRRRLTHSLEVAQVAGTFARAFKLNEVAAEAIALGHDIGHAPFGHAGEDALNKKLVALTKGDVKKEFGTSVLVFGFDHCVQSVEQVSRICADYGKDTPGLNLSFDVRDGILKHIYSGDADVAKNDENKRTFSALGNIVQLDKYKCFQDNCGSLEAQCVWIADKIGYLLGDMEDALRAGIFSASDLEHCELVQKIWETHKKHRKEHGDATLAPRHSFLAFKRKAVAVLILDCVQSTEERLRDAAPKSVDDVFAIPHRIIDVGEVFRKLWGEFYREFQKGKLYVHDKVKLCEFKARNIVEGLFDAYVQEPKLIPAEFAERTTRRYEGVLLDTDVPTMVVRNYLAGMTDSFATEQHKQLYMSSERAGLL